MSAFTTVTVKISKTKIKRLTAGKKTWRNLIYRWRMRRFWRQFWSWRWRRLRTKTRNKFACSKSSSSTSAMLFAAIFPPGQRACNFDPSADRNVFSSRLCDRLRLSPIQLSLRSSAIIWKALTSFFLCASPCHQSRKKKLDERKCPFPCLAYCCIQKLLSVHCDNITCLLWSRYLVSRQPGESRCRVHYNVTVLIMK